jgi:hypothetical protein
MAPRKPPKLTRFRSPREGTLRLESWGKKMPTEMPAHVRPFADFMRGRGKPTKRDILKAYLITMSSIQRQAIARDAVCLTRPHLRRLKLDKKVRPEDLFSKLLRGPAGKAYLDAGEKGVYDHTAAREMAEDMRCYGLVFAEEGKDPGHGGLFKNILPYAVKHLMPRAAEIAKLASRKVPREQAYTYIKRHVSGIAAAKTGFFFSLLGRGDIPTLDAKEIDLWVSEWPEMYRRDKHGRPLKPKPRWGDVEQEISVFEKLPFRMPKENRKNRMHLQHHAIWDAAAGSETTHQEIIDAMQLAGPRYRIVSEK